MTMPPPGGNAMSAVSYYASKGMPSSLRFLFLFFIPSQTTGEDVFHLRAPPLGKEKSKTE
jgi:hypothetical protein